MTSKRHVTCALTRCLFVMCVVTVNMAAVQTISHQGRQPAGYCVPEVWMGGRASTLVVVGKSGESTVERTFANVVYSARRQKVVIDDNLYEREAQFVRRIFDYPAKVLYTITGDMAQRCTKTALPGPFVRQCVPGNSTVTLTNSTLGLGQNEVSIMELSGVRNNVNYRVSLTYSTHMPIYEQLWGGNDDGQHFVQTLSFYNVSISQDLPAILFKPPPACSQLSLSLHQMAERPSNHIQRPLLVMP
ncbi:uncharacterized protein LOC143277816 [Babylonia areolata]|uniref:uncharacterized protein LOC143277816 n=1 Tax=Babylonia areolata TaxID=304850 RepID=UPI003FD279B0